MSAADHEAAVREAERFADRLELSSFRAAREEAKAIRALVGLLQQAEQRARDIVVEAHDAYAARVRVLEEALRDIERHVEKYPGVGMAEWVRHRARLTAAAAPPEEVSEDG